LDWFVTYVLPGAFGDELALQEPAPPPMESAMLASGANMRMSKGVAMIWDCNEETHTSSI